ncbi:MAG: RNA polymerase sigma-I factor [Peptococcaceae bacterium]|nr:RNA polymerase sigma-I factor [Peptococcaceae bacterium]
MLPVIELDEKLSLIRNGDSKAREDFIESHRHFIARAAVKVCGRSLEWDRDDELSIGLAAFNEAIDRFDENRGVPFPAFARLIIKSRITDFLRRQHRHSAHSCGSLDDNVQEYSALEISLARDRYLEEEAAREREEEVAEFSRLIGQFGISFDDLVKSSPRHRDTRASLQEIARRLAGDEELFTQLMTTGKLPVAALSRMSGASVKTVERGRRYIIAIALIWRFCEDFLHLCTFIKPPGKGSRSA